MTVDNFPTLALERPEAVEDLHMGNPDFRLGGRIFATFAFEKESRRHAKLLPEQQATRIAVEPPALTQRQGIPKAIEFVR